jgi:hypothetical protein
MVRPDNQERKMTNFIRKIATAAAVVATALTLSFAPTAAATAGEMSFGLGLGDPMTGIMVGVAGKIRQDNMGPVIVDQDFHDNAWKELQREDEELHDLIQAHGLNVLIQQDHDCNVVKKIKALIHQMRANRLHYIDIGAADAVTSEDEDISYWTKELKKAQRECEKVWF